MSLCLFHFIWYKLAVYQHASLLFLFSLKMLASLNNHHYCINALSLQGGMLYWCDARTDKIERINLETGENRELVLANNNMDMFAVSVFEEFIYWSDRLVQRLFNYIKQPLRNLFYYVQDVYIISYC